jgi:DNA-binding MarR family transcriptional regulator
MTKQNPETEPDAGAPTDGPFPRFADERAARMSQTLGRVARSLIFRGGPEPPLNDLPISQMRCLMTVAFDPGRKMQELAEKLGVQRPALSQLVDKLVRRGLLERRADPTDRRVVRLHLTETAHSAVLRGHRAHEARSTAAVRRLDEDAFAQVIAGLGLLADAAEQAEAVERAPTTADSSALQPGPDPLVELLARRAHRARQGRGGRTDNNTETTTPGGAPNR